MNSIIEKIMRGKDVEQIIENIKSYLYFNGPNNPTYLEIFGYLKLYQPETFRKHENEILYLMGLFFKKGLKPPTSITGILLDNYKEAINDKYNESYTPVQADIVEKTDNNKYFSFSSATSTGKSFVFNKLILEEKKDIAIIVPSRALINEYYIKVTEIIKDKRVNVLTFPYIINTKNSIRNIFILTPERAKELFKIKNRINLQLVLFDEAQLGDEESTRGILFDSIVRRINKNFKEAKLLFAHPYIENPEAQLQKNNLTDSNHTYQTYKYRNVGQIFTCIDDKYNYYHFGIDKEIMGYNKITMNYDPIKKCIEDNGTVLIYTSKSSIYNNSILDHMKQYIDMCPEVKNEAALEIIAKIKEIIGGSSDSKSNTYSNLLNLLKKGIVIHHGSLPLSVRLLVEKFTQHRFCRLCFATSTLYQGINMPFDIVYIKRFEGSKKLLIKNLIGRAGRSTDNAEFDYGQIIVSKKNMSDLRNCIKEKNTIDDKSLLDSISEDDSAELIDFKESLKNGTFNDEYNMTQNQLIKLEDKDIDIYIETILSTLLQDNSFITDEGYNLLDKLTKDMIIESFSKIYSKHLSDRELTDAEKRVLENAIRIFIWQINGRKFKEIIGYRFSYIMRRNERQKLQLQIKTENDSHKKLELIYELINLRPQFTIAAGVLPNPQMPLYNMLKGLLFKDVSYDLIMYDTYDYIDKVWGFCLMDVFYAAFHLYYLRTNDIRADIMSKYIKYSTISDDEIWLIKYGFEFEEIEWIKPCVEHIDEQGITFNGNIDLLSQEQLSRIDRYRYQ
ncbi:MAG: DEAD/DEAH box helicase [Bacilli bacterium]|nr:DEAD/DEAH box helicase [Bacilli bacterium]